MPTKVDNIQQLNTQEKESPSIARTVANWAAPIELAGDLAMLGNSTPARVGGAIVSTGANAVGEIARWYNGDLSGLTTVSEIGNNALWNILGNLGYAKNKWALLRKKKLERYINETFDGDNKSKTKYYNIIRNLEKNGDTKTAENLSTAFNVSQAFSNALARKGKWLNRYKKLIQKTEETASKIANQAKDLKMTRAATVAGKWLGGTAISGGLTYGIPGAEAYIEDNNLSFTPANVVRGSILYGFPALGNDATNILNDEGAWARMGRTFVFPWVAAKQTGKLPKTSGTPSKKAGGKLNYINFLRYANNT